MDDFDVVLFLNLFVFMYTNNYSNTERYDKVIVKIKWRSFLPLCAYVHFVTYATTLI